LITIMKYLLVLLTFTLAACGGGDRFEPSISEIQVQSLRYGKTAVILLAGHYLRADMVAETGSCTNPSFGTNSTPETAILNCKVTATGTLPMTLRSAEGKTLYSTTLTVPTPQVTLNTSLGSVVMELDPQAAPITVNNFLAYVGSNYYTNTLFHRVIAGFVVQGGGYTAGLVKKPGQTAPIALESNNGLLNLRGTVAMARTDVPDSATSEFFVNLVDNTSLNYQSAASPGYAVFGKVVQGLEVIDAIAAVPTSAQNGAQNVPTTDVTITAAAQTQ